MDAKQDFPRTIAIIVVLGLAAALYLGGVAGQLHANYLQWEADGGMNSDARIPTVIIFSTMALSLKRESSR